MTLQQHPTGAAAQHVGRPRLGSLVPDPGHFASDVWGRTPLHTPAARLDGRTHELFSADAVDELVSVRGLRTPFLRVARNGATAGDREFTAPGGVGATIGDQLSDDKLLRLFADGATMVLQGLHRTWAPLVAFAQDLGGELGHPVQVNGYVTPAQSRGFDDHYDVHDVFVLQVSGSKHWRVRPPVHPHPLRDQPWTDHRPEVAAAALGQPYLDVVLRPGDTLYVPRGWLHSATALGGATTHLTMGVHTWTRHHLLEHVLAEAAAALALDPEVRASLGVGVQVGRSRDVVEDLELVRVALLRAVQAVSGDAVADRLARAARAGQRAAPVRPLATLAAAEALEEDTELGLRGHVAAAVTEHPDGSATICSRAGELVLDAEEFRRAEPVVRGGVVRAGALGPELAKRLLVSGLAVATPR